MAYHNADRFGDASAEYKQAARILNVNIEMMTAAPEGDEKTKNAQDLQDLKAMLKEINRKITDLADEAKVAKMREAQEKEKAASGAVAAAGVTTIGFGNNSGGGGGGAAAPAAGVTTIGFGNSSSGGGGGGGGASAAPIDMSRYYNQSGGCFKPGCVVAMADGSTKLVEEVQQGDRVMAGGSYTAKSAAPAATVMCVVKTQCPGGVTPLVTLGGGAGPSLTPYHPVCIAGVWVFPGSLAETTMQETDYVYTYLLEAGASSMLIDGMKCCTLGHGLDADVVRHAYLGSHAAITADLEQVPGWDAGLVLLEPDSFVRAATGQICTIKHRAAAAPTAYLPRVSGLRNNVDAAIGTDGVTMAATAIVVAC